MIRYDCCLLRQRERARIDRSASRYAFCRHLYHTSERADSNGSASSTRRYISIERTPYTRKNTQLKRCLLMPRRLQQRAKQSPTLVSFAVSMPHQASSLCKPHFPTSVQCLAVDHPRVQYANHERADSPLKLGNTLYYRPSPPCALKELLCFFSRFTNVFPIPQNLHCINTSQWVASERNPQSAPCVWPTPHLVARRYHRHYYRWSSVQLADTILRTVTGGPMS
jgi:hypothetical protein